LFARSQVANNGAARQQSFWYWYFPRNDWAWNQYCDWNTVSGQTECEDTGTVDDTACIQTVSFTRYLDLCSRLRSIFISWLARPLHTMVIVDSFVGAAELCLLLHKQGNHSVII
jgi:hypothetical protein